MNTRIKANPLPEEYERRHGAMLDEIHRLIAGFFDGCVTMPHGISFDKRDRPKRATNMECQHAEIWFSTSLKFRLDEPTIAEDAAGQLEGFAHELFDVAKKIRENGKAIEGSPKAGNRKTA